MSIVTDGSVFIAYLLTTAAFQLLFGKFYSFFSIKYIYLGAIGIFELGSLICGVAPNSTALIIGRAIAGIGSAGIFSGALIIVAYSVPLRQRPMYSGGIGAMYGIACMYFLLFLYGWETKLFGWGDKPNSKSCHQLLARA